jgi:hypothetical protein
VVRLSIFILLTALAVSYEAVAWGSQGRSDVKADIFRIVRTNFFGSIWNESMARASVLFQDGGQSFAVPGGTAWVFGDTFLGFRDSEGEPHYTGGISCSIALLKEGAAPFPPALEYWVDERGMAKSPFELLPGESEEKNRIWPLGGVHLDGRSYIYYSLIEITDDEPPWNFRGVGAGLARSESPIGRYERLRPGGDWRFPIAPIQVLHVGEWLYLYEAGEIEGRKGVILARVPASRIEEPSAYEFFTGLGPTFSPHRDDARLLVEDVYGQVSIAWDEYLGKYLMACASDFFRPHEILFRIADEPWGPFSPPVAGIQVPETHGKTKLIYGAYLHPELFRDAGRVIVLTFCPMLEKGFANPEMVEVELQRIDPKGE